MLTTERPSTTQRRDTPVSVKLDSNEKERFSQLASTKQRSVHFLMLQAAREYLEREEKRVELYTKAHESFEHFQATGLHVTHEEMGAWINSLGTSNELKPPVCHK